MTYFIFALGTVYRQSSGRGSPIVSSLTAQGSGCGTVSNQVLPFSVSVVLLGSVFN